MTQALKRFAFFPLRRNDVSRCVYTVATKVGVQLSRLQRFKLDSGLRRNDDRKCFASGYFAGVRE
jgi:hypothetical protein